MDTKKSSRIRVLRRSVSYPTFRVLRSEDFWCFMFYSMLFDLSSFLISCSSRCLCTRRQWFTSAMGFHNQDPAAPVPLPKATSYCPQNPIARTFEISYGLFSELFLSLSAWNEPVNLRRHICSSCLRWYDDRNVDPAFERRKWMKRIGYNHANGRVDPTLRIDIVVLIPSQVVIGYSGTRASI